MNFNDVCLNIRQYVEDHPLIILIYVAEFLSISALVLSRLNKRKYDKQPVGILAGKILELLDDVSGWTTPASQGPTVISCLKYNIQLQASETMPTPWGFDYNTKIYHKNSPRACKDITDTFNKKELYLIGAKAWAMRPKMCESAAKKEADALLKTVLSGPTESDSKAPTGRAVCDNCDELETQVFDLQQIIAQKNQGIDVLNEERERLGEIIKQKDALLVAADRDYRNYHTEIVKLQAEVRRLQAKDQATDLKIVVPTLKPSIIHVREVDALPMEIKTENIDYIRHDAEGSVITLKDQFKEIRVVEKEPEITEKLKPKKCAHCGAPARHITDGIRWFCSDCCERKLAQAQQNAAGPGNIVLTSANANREAAQFSLNAASIERHCKIAGLSTSRGTRVFIKGGGSYDVLESETIVKNLIQQANSKAQQEKEKDPRKCANCGKSPQNLTHDSKRWFCLDDGCQLAYAISQNAGIISGGTVRLTLPDLHTITLHFGGSYKLESHPSRMGTMVTVAGGATWHVLETQEIISQLITRSYCKQVV